jgi:hypothetical protein
MRAIALLLLLAAPVVADDAAAARAELAEAEQALAAEPDNALAQRRWAKAARAVARVLQRTEGYQAAIEFLEARLTHPLTVEAYAEACLWGGQEERGVAHLRSSRGVAVRHRIGHELELLGYLRRYDEAARRAREVGWDEGARWAEERAARRARLLGRGVRAYWVAAIGFVVMAAAAVALYFLAPGVINRRNPEAQKSE